MLLFELNTGAHVTRAMVGTISNVQSNHVVQDFFRKKVLEVWSPKSEVLVPNEVLGDQKSLLGPLKHKKIDFLKKPELCDLTEHWGWFPQWPFVTRAPSDPSIQFKK